MSINHNHQFYQPIRSLCNISYQAAFSNHNHSLAEFSQANQCSLKFTNRCSNTMKTLTKLNDIPYRDHNSLSRIPRTTSQLSLTFFLYIQLFFHVCFTVTYLCLSTCLNNNCTRLYMYMSPRVYYDILPPQRLSLRPSEQFLSVCCRSASFQTTTLLGTSLNKYKKNYIHTKKNLYLSLCLSFIFRCPNRNPAVNHSLTRYLM